jgi:nucleoside-diphosphate-sugar epimerase
MDVLVLGGTQFFGRRLVVQLVEEGHRVTVATRGTRDDGLGDAVRRLHIERTDARSLASSLTGTYDVVYDQIGYTPQDAQALLEALGNRAGRLVFTSSGSVYDPQDTLIEEEDFDPWRYPVDLGCGEYEYGEGKRQAEAYLFQHARFPVVAARLSFVLSGTDDYTGRFDFQVEHVARGQSLGVLDPDHEVSFVTAWDGAACLAYLGTQSAAVGPVNVVNPGYFSAGGLARRIGRELGRMPRLHVARPGDPHLSPYALLGTRRVSPARVQKLGFPMPPLEASLPGIIDDVVERLGL